MSKHLGVTISDEMHKALEMESKKNLNVPISSLVRLALEQWLTDRGHSIQTEVTWGGYRRQGEEEDEQGQQVAVAMA